MAKPPQTLIEAFRAVADNAVENIVCLIIDDDKFEAATMRVLSAWSSAAMTWTKPNGKCPDDGRPTNDAWRWLVSGLDVDYDELASAAGVGRSVAVAKAAVLLGHRLVMPDGSITTIAHKALQEHVKNALKMKSTPRRPKQDEKTN